MNKTRVLITVELDGLIEAARGAPDVEIVTAYDRPGMLQQIDQADVVCLARFDAELLRRARKLRWVHAMMAGVEGVLFPEFINNQIPLTCVKQCFGMPGAQHAMASMLAVVSRLNDYWWLRSHSKLEWRLPYELQGRTLGILGFGNIGRTLAQLAKPFGIRILAMARTPHADPAPADQLLLPHELPLLLGESDFVVVAVPLTDQTRGMIDEPQLRLMKRSAWFIDISGRPAIVNQEAVIRALEHQWIGGADLQFATAPPPFSSLWTMENLIMSQYSANSQEESRRCNELFAENLRRFQKGEPLMGLVDKKAGY